VVAQGETLFHIALTYGLTVDQLAAANNITDPTRIYVGQVLIIPTSAQPSGQQAAQPTAQPAAQTGGQAVAPGQTFVYTVQTGDTVNIISRRFGVSVAAILSANALPDPDHIVPGQQLIIPGSSAPSAPIATAIPGGPTPIVLTATPLPTIKPAPTNAVTTRTHVVAPGEDLSIIANQYGISWTTIAQANNISDPNTIYVGQVLQIPTSDMGADASDSASQGNPPTPSIAGKEIIVTLHDQRIYIYDNYTLLKTYLVSTGLPGSPTVQGDFHIYVKYTSQLMVGPGYYLPGVPWVMYFYEGYGLHGTYWHHNFGHPMSHGCVNLPTPEAEWLYGWAEVGTLVHVQW
jgi:LysM repeat protein